MGPTVTRPIQDPLAVLSLKNRPYMLHDRYVFLMFLITFNVEKFYVFDVTVFIYIIAVHFIDFMCHCILNYKSANLTE